MQTTNSKPFAPVALVQAPQYDPALIDLAVERLLELLNIPGEWFCGKRVLIKPNLLMRRQPQEATTTIPRVDCTPLLPCAVSTRPAGCSKLPNKAALCSILMSATRRSLPKMPASAANLTSSIRWCRQI